MAERFDILVLGIAEDDALSLLFAKTADVPRLSDRYLLLLGWDCVVVIRRLMR